MKFHVLLFLLMLIFPVAAHSETADPELLRFGVVGMGGGAFETLKAYEKELNLSLEHFRGERFRQTPPLDLSDKDLIFVSFASGDLEKEYKKVLSASLTKNPQQKIFCVGPVPICRNWQKWVGKDKVNIDETLARYYGLSKESMKNMLLYAMIHYFGRPGSVDPPGTGKLVKIFHPDYGDLDDLDTYWQRAEKAGWNREKSPRVALGTWRHHLLFHQPKVVEALIRELEKLGMAAVSFTADDPSFRENLMEFKPDLVIMNSHTREPPAFWDELGVPRFHAIWFTNESIAEWRKSNQPGMKKSGMFHLLVSAELKGATECLTAGGTEHGGDSGEEIVPIPNRIRRIANRAKAWINLQDTANQDKKIALMIYDRQVDKSGLMSGPAHSLNAPESMVRFLNEMKAKGYNIDKLPTNSEELLSWIVDHGRQMGTWEPGPLDKLARSGKAVLVPEDRYRLWFEEKVPQERRSEMIEQWGEPPGKLMVWENKGKRFLVLPKIDLGNVILMTQPPKGETITSSTKEQDPDESLLPPTHHFLATYFWLQESFHADAVVHFGSHGSEWLYPGKQAVLSRADWSDMLLGNMPNVNPWLASNTAELLPCKRRARAVTIDFMPPPLMEAGLSDELMNLESAINKYEALEEGALKSKFATSITEQVKANNLDRDLSLEIPPNGMLKVEAIDKVSQYLHDLSNEYVPASMHILGEPPADDLRIPYLVHCMGKRFYKSAGPLLGLDPKNPVQLRELKQKSEDILRSMFLQNLSPLEAIQAAGGKTADANLPEAVTESLNMVVEMQRGMERTSDEITKVFDALDGKYILPGPSGNPERNPGVLPTGRNMFLLNPEELPSRSSWELGTKLMRDYLAEHYKNKGRYPEKIAFSLVPFTTYSDYGIIESQILYLMGVRPVWDTKNRVRDVELIPANELDRPRIDVFLSARSIYRDELPSMMKLLDKAIRLAATLDEKNNFVFRNSEKTRNSLENKGFSPEKARALSMGRMFGAKPEEILDSHNWFFYLTERSGEWETREDLLEVYLEQSKYIYTEGAWGERSPESFDEAIIGTDHIFRSWYDNRDFVLSNKFTWWVDGTLSMAIEHLTGKEPEYLFVDVRDTDEARIIDSKDAVQQDMRIRVTNPKWIEAMMKEGYAGGNIMAQNVDNLMGWEITRRRAIADSNWQEVTDIYVRDVKNLGLKKWYDTTNPYAFQKLSVTLLETMRKGFWPADDATRLDVTTAYAESVARHGRASGAREGGNEGLQQFVEKTLKDANTPEAKALLEAYQAKSAELKDTPTETEDSSQEPVQGKRLAKQEPKQQTEAVEKTSYLAPLLVGLALLIILAGYNLRGRRITGRKQR